MSATVSGTIRTASGGSRRLCESARQYLASHSDQIHGGGRANYAYILYRTKGSETRVSSQLSIQDIIDRNDLDKILDIVIPPEGAQLDILVENLARISYSFQINDRKDIPKEVRLTQ